jgi:hypothetical protein
MAAADVAGVVAETETEAFALGDEVIGYSDRLNLTTKAQAEYVVWDPARWPQHPSWTSWRPRRCR